MANTQLADIIEPTVWADLPSVAGPEKTAFAEAGIIATGPLMNELADAKGKTAELPFWKDLDASDEPNLSSDDATSDGTPAKVTQGEQISRKAFLNQGYSASDLVNEIAMGQDALQHIRNRSDRYWERSFQRRLIASVQGIHADNAANDSGDMTYDIASESIAGQSASTLWSQAAFIEAAYTMGDMVDGITAIAVHSTVAKQITEQNGAEDVRDSDGNLLYRSYLGRRIIVDDTLPAIAGSTDGVKYLSVLFGPQAFGFGQGNPTVPVEVDRDASNADGGGVEEVWNRKTWLIHPFGFQATGTPSGASSSLTELKTAAMHDRVIDRKNVPMAFLWTN